MTGSLSQNLVLSNPAHLARVFLFAQRPATIFVRKSTA